MAGLYIHIPFCSRACHYCNFHFSTNLKHIGEMVDAIATEMRLRNDYLGGEPLTSVYFGGGTPSLLAPAQTSQLLNTARELFGIDREAEITLEANPDDLEPVKLHSLAAAGINRLSIGVQSFFDEDLEWMNRLHSAAQARDCIRGALAAGIRHISIDLIYGLPGLSDERWLTNLRTAVNSGVDHISAYALTVEPRTALAHLISTGRSEQVDEAVAATHFEIMVDFLRGDMGFEQYEISNFAKEGSYARHSTSYWRGEPYLGVGPSAHSYDHHTRSWNVSNNAGYLKSIAAGELPLGTEVLTVENRFNEYIMTGLRTKSGCSLAKIESGFGRAWTDQLIEKAAHKIKQGLMKEENGTLLLTAPGRFLADGIAADLFV